MGRYVISMTATGKPQEFLATDSHSGGYPYWSSFFSSAEIYDSLEKAQAEINGAFFTKNSVMGDGTIYPPMMIHSGLGLNNKLQENTGTLSIDEIVLTPVETRNVSSKLHVGIDAQRMRENALNKLTPEERQLLKL